MADAQEVEAKPLEKADALEAARKAMNVAAREIGRLAEKEKLSGFDGMDLERYAKICLAHDHHELTWLGKFDPAKLSDEVLKRVMKKAESDGSLRPRRATG